MTNLLSDQEAAVLIDRTVEYIKALVRTGKILRVDGKIPKEALLAHKAVVDAKFKKTLKRMLALAAKNGIKPACGKLAALLPD